MNKKILKAVALLLTLMLVLCVGVGCGKKKKDKEAAEKPAEQEGLVVQRTISPAIVEPTQEPQGAPLAPPEHTMDPEDIEQQEGAVPISGDVTAIAYANGSDINVREKGASDATILGTLPLNTIVYVTKKDAGNDWSEIDYNGKQAFVATHLLNFIINSNEMKFEGSADFNGDDINIRADGTTDSDSIGKASKGTKVDVFKKDAGHGWTMIRYEDRVGFVASHLLTFSE